MQRSSVYKIEQFNYEHTMWLRQLDFFKQENAWLKTRLSAVLDGKTDAEVLPQAEYFQNQFIGTDDLIEDLRLQVTQLNMLKPQSSADKSLAARQTVLRGKMELLENDFISLKNNFGKFVTAVVQ
jgi:hypothetical protein